MYDWESFGCPARLLLLFLFFWTTNANAESLPIRIDSSRNGVVFVRSVDAGGTFQELSVSTPATYDAKVGERVDVKVVAQDGFFVRWQGARQNIAGPSNITIRMEKGFAWDRIATVGGGLLLLVLGIFLAWRRKAKVEADRARSEIVKLEERAVSAEKMGSLARTLGEYEVLEKLGAGAMGVVYKVRNPAGDIYAAKVPNEMDDRVLREAEVSASLRSPNIVHCYGMVEGEPNFLLLEYMDGQTVHEWLEGNNRPSLDEIDRLISQLLEGLEVAHLRGVFHRDIKPENLFLAKTKDEKILKVMDFGLASSINAARLTRTGEAMGTPVYASPEQLSGTPVDATTDLYSVGVFIYELTTGLLPWSQTDPVALTMQKYKSLPEEPKTHRPEMPEEWNRLVIDLLQGDPLKRPRSVGELKIRWQNGRQAL